MSLKVLLLEDDYLQRRDIQNMLEAEFQAAVSPACTESEFRDAFEKICRNPPDLAILDVMVRWANPSREAVAIPEFAKRPHVAGLRCAEMLRNDPRTQSVKVIIYSVLSPEDFGGVPVPDGVVSVVKEADFSDLLEAIRATARQPIAN